MSERDDSPVIEPPPVPPDAGRGPAVEAGSAEGAAPPASLPEATTPAGPSPKRRLLSLDAFRGFDIAAMLFVNMTWDRSVFHPQFFHVEWNEPAQGATFTDLVFPWFLFIMGCAIPLSVRSGRGKGKRWGGVMLAGLRRALVLYLLGVMLTVASGASSTPLAWTDLLKWNILQLIGVGYLVALGVFLMPRWAQVGFVIAVLLGKWGLMTLVSWDWVSGLVAARGPTGAPVGAGTWEHFDAIKRVLNLEHLEPGWTRWVGGWLGMSQQFLPCAAIAVLGGWATEMLTGPGRAWARVCSVLGFGAALTGAAYALQWGYDPAGGGLLGQFTVPFSKWFFSPAYCLLSAGTGVLLLVAFYLVIDAWKLTTALVLRVWGLNAIVLYVGAELSFKTIFSKWLISHPGGEGQTDSLAGGFIAWVTQWTGSAAVGGWAFVLTWLAGWWWVCWWMYRRQLFVRV